MKIDAFAIGNTFTRDIPLDVQIAEGICEWQAEVADETVYGGYRVAFGRSRDEAIANLRADIPA